MHEEGANRRLFQADNRNMRKSTFKYIQSNLGNGDIAWKWTAGNWQIWQPCQIVVIQGITDSSITFLWAERELQWLIYFSLAVLQVFASLLLQTD